MVNNLTAGINLQEAGQEAVEVKGGGKTAVKSGYYAVCLNGFGAFGSVPKEMTWKGQTKTTDEERNHVSFELLKLVKAVDPEAADTKLVMEYDNDDGTKDIVPTMVHAGGNFGVRRTSKADSPYAVLLKALQNAMPMGIVKKLREEGKTVQQVYPTIKSMYGQQFIMYVHASVSGEYDNIDITFNDKLAEAATKYNESKGFNKAVHTGVELYRLDRGAEEEFIDPVEEVLEPTNGRAYLWDVADKNMQQVHLESVAHLLMYVGQGCSPVEGKPTAQYCQLLPRLLQTPKFKATAVYEKFLSKALTIPEAKVYAKKDDDKKTVETPEPETIVAEITTAAVASQAVADDEDVFDID